MERKGSGSRYMLNLVRGKQDCSQSMKKVQLSQANITFKTTTTR